MVIANMPRISSVRGAGTLESRGFEPARQARRSRAFLVAGLCAVGTVVAGTIAWRSDEPAPGGSPRAAQAARPASVTPAAPAPVVARAGARAAAGEAREPGAEPQPNAVLDANSIVVLPQPDAGADPQVATRLQELYEEFLVQLRSIDGLTVVSPERVQPFIGSLLPEEEIARQLGAGTIVVLGLWTEGRPVMLTTLVIDGATGDSRGTSSGVLPEPVTAAGMRERVQHAVAFIERMRTYRTIDRPTRIAEARAAVLNAALSDGERAAALQMLPLSSPEGRDDAIVAAAVEIATTTGSANLRAHVWSVVQGVGHPYLVDPLLQSLAYDADPYVRRMAAGTLRDFRDEPRVQEALAQARAGDPSEAVRESARLALLSDQERNELALRTLLDESLPALERLDALTVYDGRMLRHVPLTAGAARAVFDIATSSQDVMTRSIAWGTLKASAVHDPDFIGALLEDVANHPSGSVRSAAARALETYRDEPAVRAVLEQARNDRSAQVRRAARSALDPKRR